MLGDPCSRRVSKGVSDKWRGPGTVLRSGGHNRARGQDRTSHERYMRCQLGHSSIKTTLLYFQLAQGPSETPEHTDSSVLLCGQFQPCLCSSARPEPQSAEPR